MKKLKFDTQNDGILRSQKMANELLLSMWKLSSAAFPWFIMIVDSDGRNKSYSYHKVSSFDLDTS